MLTQKQIHFILKSDIGVACGKVAGMEKTLSLWQHRNKALPRKSSRNCIMAIGIKLKWTHTSVTLELTVRRICHSRVSSSGIWATLIHCNLSGLLRLLSASCSASRYSSCRGVDSWETLCTISTEESDAKYWPTVRDINLESDLKYTLNLPKIWMSLLKCPCWTLNNILKSFRQLQKKTRSFIGT